MWKVLEKKRGKFKDFMNNYSCSHIVDMMGILPRIGGFPLFSENLFVLFWILHFSLSTYVYVVGVIFYQLSNISMLEAVSSIFNLMIVSLIYNTGFWFLLKRKDIHSLLKAALLNDALVREKGKYLDEYKKLMKMTKNMILLCYGCHFINDILVFIPSRTITIQGFSLLSCVGLEPLTAFPNRQICMAILAGQELTSAVVVASYDMICIFLFSHTTNIFLILCKDVEDLAIISKNFDNSEEMMTEVRENLKNFVHRHSLVLNTVRKMQRLYNLVIGVALILNIISTCTFFILPFEIALNFVPLLAYTFTVFFLYCLQGQRLFNASVAFEIAVYSCGWENLRPREQRVVFLMLKLSQRPVVLYAADIVPIILTTFSSTVQSIYRLVTVFKV